MTSFNELTCLIKQTDNFNEHFSLCKQLFSLQLSPKEQQELKILIQGLDSNRLLIEAGYQGDWDTGRHLMRLGADPSKKNEKNHSFFLTCVKDNLAPWREIFADYPQLIKKHELFQKKMEKMEKKRHQKTVSEVDRSNLKDMKFLFKGSMLNSEEIFNLVSFEDISNEQTLKELKSVHFGITVNDQNIFQKILLIIDAEKERIGVEGCIEFLKNNYKFFGVHTPKNFGKTMLDFAIENRLAWSLETLIQAGACKYQTLYLPQIVLFLFKNKRFDLIKQSTIWPEDYRNKIMIEEKTLEVFGNENGFWQKNKIKKMVSTSITKKESSKETKEKKKKPFASTSKTGSRKNSKKEKACFISKSLDYSSREVDEYAIKPSKIKEPIVVIKKKRIIENPSAEN